MNMPTIKNDHMEIGHISIRSLIYQTILNILSLYPITYIPDYIKYFISPSDCLDTDYFKYSISPYNYLYTRLY